MKVRQQLNPLRIGKGLLSLLALFVMLLAPQGAWAQEDYGLKVAGVSVTSENASNITGQTISEGTVSYTPKTGTTPATLTLSSAYILGEIESSVDEDLAILVIGTNTITTSLDHAVIGKSGGTNNNLMLTYNGDGSGAELRVNGLSSIDELPLNWISCTKIWKTSEWDFGENEEGLNPDLCDWYTKEKCGFISIAPATKYNVWIGGIQLTSNHDSSDGVSFSEYYNRLTLENATIAPTNASGIEYKGTDDFTISLIGNSSIQTTGGNEAIRYGGAGTDTPKLSFAHDNYGFPCSLQLSSASVSVISSGFSSLEGVNGINQINLNDNKLGLTPANPLQYGINGLVTTDETPAAVTSVKFGTPYETYDVSIAGTSVTSENYNDVLKDGKVTFNSQTNTLTLNNATIDMSQKTGYPIESSLTNLNVKLIGSSVLTPNSTSKSGIRYTGSESNPTITLNADNSSSCLLKVNGVSDRAAMFSGYTNSNSIVTQGDGWRTYTEGSGDDVSSTMEYIDYYDLTVAGVPVTNKNAADIQGENISGSVSFNYVSGRLILNGATISGGVVWESSSDLYVNMNGENSVSGGDSYAFKSTDNTMTNQWIVFEKADNSSSATITLTNNTQNDKTGTIGGGFDATHYDGLFRIDDNNDTQFTTTFTTALFTNGSGSKDDPYIIKTANDLKNFSNFINRNVIANTACAKLSDDINAETGLDCSNLTGFEPIGAGDFPYKGTFNGNGKTIRNLSYTAPTDMEYVGLFGYVSGATIYDLTINNCMFSGSKHVGGIAGYINDATISSCTVNNSTISCSNTENDDNVRTAGGIVGYCEYDPSGDEPTTVSGNTVTGVTTISSSKTAGSGNAVAGAIVGHHRTTTFTNNIYEYSVSVSTKQPTDENTTVSSGYIKRGSGCTIDDSDETPQAEYTLTDVDGITMNTMKVILPAETPKGTVMGLEGTYYDYFVDGNDGGILVVPGQMATIQVIPNGLYKIVSFSAVNLSTEEDIDNKDITVTDVQENNEYAYTKYEFPMPDADVEFTAGFAFDIANNDYTASIANVIYTGEALVPMTVILTPEEGTQGLQTVEMVNTETTSDFEITKYQKVVNDELVDAESPIDADTYTVTIKGVGNYTGTTTASYTIEKAHIQEAQFTKPAANNNLVYNGEAQQLVTAGSVPQGATVKYYSRPLSEEEFENEGFIMICEPNDEDYTDNVPTSTNVGYFGIVYMVDGGNNYVDIEATQTLKVAIDPAEISSVTLNKTKMEYNSSEQTVTISSVKAGTDSNLDVPSTDYTVALDGNAVTDGIKAKNTGTYTVTVTAKDKCNFTGSADATFTISDRTLVVSDVTFHNGWTTYYSADGNVLLPANSNVGAFVASGVGENSVTVTQISNIPEKVAVLLNNATTTTTTNVFGTDVKGNLLEHATSDKQVDPAEGDFYGLYNGAFMRITDKSTIPAGKNYLLIPNAVNVNTGAPKLNIVFDNEANMTGIDEVRNKMEDVRGDVYDLMGRKVQKPSKKGLYISNGHKVVINK